MNGRSSKLKFITSKRKRNFPSLFFSSSGSCYSSKPATAIPELFFTRNYILELIQLPSESMEHAEKKNVTA